MTCSWHRPCSEGIREHPLDDPISCALQSLKQRNGNKLSSICQKLKRFTDLNTVIEISIIDALSILDFFKGKAGLTDFSMMCLFTSILPRLGSGRILQILRGISK